MQMEDMGFSPIRGNAGTIGSYKEIRGRYENIQLLWLSKATWKAVKAITM